MADRRYNISLKIKALDQLSAPLARAGAAFKKLGKNVKMAQKNMSKLKKTSQGLGKNLGGIISPKFAIGAGLAAFAKSSVDAAVDFQSAMNMVGGVTRTQIGNVVKPEFKELTRLAREMGATTQFSATEAAEGMKFLAMAGLTPAQIQAGALQKSLELAASAQLDLGSAADIVTNIMSGYQMEVKELTMVNDTLVNAFTRANTDLRGLGEAFKFVGPVGKAAGLDFKEVTAAISLMSSAGIRGEMAGTALRGMITRLSAPVGKGKKLLKQYGIQVLGADGKMRSITDIMGQFTKKGVPFNKIIRIMGQRAGPAFQALLGAKYNGKTGPEALKLFAEGLKEQGIAVGLADAQMKGLPGAMKLFKSAFESLQLSIVDGEVGGTLDTIVRNLADMMQRMSEGVGFLDIFEEKMWDVNDAFAEWVQTSENGFATFLRGIGDVVQGLFDLFEGIEDLAGGIADFFMNIPDFAKGLFGVGDDVNISKTITSANESASEATIKVLVQSNENSTATIEGVHKKGKTKVSAKTNTSLGDLFVPRIAVGGA